MFSKVKDYPYDADQGMCQSDQCKNVVEISDYADVEPNNEKILKRAVVINLYHLIQKFNII